MRERANTENIDIVANDHEWVSKEVIEERIMYAREKAHRETKILLQKMYKGSH